MGEKLGHWTPNILCEDLIYIRQHVSAVTKNPLFFIFYLFFFGVYNTNSTVNFKSQLLKFYHVLYTSEWAGSSVGIATGYGLDGPGIKPRWGGEIFPTCPDRPGAHPAFCTMGTGSFSGVKKGRGVTLTPHTF